MKTPQELRDALRQDAAHKDASKAPLGPKTMQDVAGTLAAILPDDNARHMVQEYLTGSESLKDASPGTLSALFSYLRPSYDADQKTYIATNGDAVAELRAVLAEAQPVPIELDIEFVGDEILVEAAKANGDSAIHEQEQNMENEQTPPPVTLPQVMHEEARCIVFTRVNVSGFEFNVTAREGATEEMILDSCRALLGAVLRIQKATGKQENHAPMQASAPPVVAQAGPVTMQAQPIPAPMPQAQQPAGNGTKAGTGALEQITVNPDGKIEFKVSGLKYPLKDSRGADVVAGLFAPETGITAAHLSQPAIYTAAQLGVMLVDWQKPDKYYDVVRVHR